MTTEDTGTKCSKYYDVDRKMDAFLTKGENYYKRYRNKNFRDRKKVTSRRSTFWA